jgi:hypothetical protein
MSVKFVNVGLIDDEMVMVEFSDHSYAASSVNELLNLQRSKRTPEPLEPRDLPN